MEITALLVCYSVSGDVKRFRFQAYLGDSDECFFSRGLLVCNSLHCANNIFINMSTVTFCPCTCNFLH